jgi:hypothetical protein
LDKQIWLQTGGEDPQEVIWIRKFVYMMPHFQYYLGRVGRAKPSMVTTRKELLTPAEKTWKQFARISFEQGLLHTMLDAG